MQSKKEKYANAFTEVYTILAYLNKDDYNKIPKSLLKTFEENRNVEYQYEMNSKVDIFSQPMMPETKAVLFNIFRDYLSNPEQKNKIKKMQADDFRKIEQVKQDKYKSNVFNIETKTTEKKSEYHLVSNQRKSFLYKMFSKIRYMIKIYIESKELKKNN